PLVREAHRDARVRPRPYLLDQPVIELLHPLAPQELHDGFTAAEELAAVSPDAVRGVGERNPLRVAAVPGILCGACLLRGAFARERGKGRAALGAHRSLGRRHERRRIAAKDQVMAWIA